MSDNVDALEKASIEGLPQPDVVRGRRRAVSECAVPGRLADRHVVLERR